MDCEQLKEPKRLTELLKGAETITPNNIYNCFRELYFEYFVRFSHKRIFIRHSFLPESAEELLQDAFTDGFIAFYKCIKEKGFKENGTVDTAFIHFCKINLLNHINKLERYNSKIDNNDPDITFNQEGKVIEENHQSLKEIINKNEGRYNLLSKAFEMLGERCRNLITWRKLENLDNKEIAFRTGIKENVVTNEVYRCQNKLKGIVDGLKLETA